MEESFDTINLEYVQTKQTSIFVKLVAVLLMVIFVVTPISEFITQLKPIISGCTYGIAGTCGCFVGGL